MKDDGLDAFRVDELRRRVTELQIDLRNACKLVANKEKALKRLAHSWAVRHGILQAKYNALLEENKTLRVRQL